MILTSRIASHGERVIVLAFDPDVFCSRNLPFEITTEEMYDIFGKYGALRQIRLYARVFR